MKKPRKRAIIAAALLLFLTAGASLKAQSEGVKTIRAEDMNFHLKFLGAREFRGRNAPSPELDIASKYIALTAEQLGLKPFMPGSSYYQEVPVEVTRVTGPASYLRLLTDGAEQKFLFPKAFTVGRISTPGVAAGNLVFLGLGLSALQLGWDDYGETSLKGKVAVILDVTLPREHPLKPEENSRLLRSRAVAAREKGALAVVTVINEAREAWLAQNDLPFDGADRYRFLGIETGTGAPPAAPAPAAPSLPFLQVDVRHEAAAAILGITRGELNQMFADIRQGKRIPSRELGSRSLEISIRFETRREKTLNVVAWLEGRDPELKKEYVVVGSHYDHLGTRDGRILPGSDDDASGAVAMFAIAKALKVERSKRSVIFVWHTAEEKGLIGAYYFVQHCPVPPERISANLNLDMISRNDPGQIYLIGSNKLSSEFDKSIRTQNGRAIGLRLDYKYEDPGHPDNFFFRSDQYPYIRYGIPAVWFFCGTTDDYHQESDVEEKADYKKMEKVARLAYLVAMEVGNKPGLLKLDLNTEITTRGQQNMKFDWRKAGRETTGQRR